MIRILLATLCAWLFVGLLAGPAHAQAAHPLGNFSVNRYDGLVVTADEIRVDHIEDLAEIPTAQTKPEFDAAGPAAWSAKRCAAARNAMALVVDSRTTELTVRSARAETRPGQAGLPTLRLECTLRAQAEGTAVRFRDEGPAGKAGWREITARGDRMTLTFTNVPAKSHSNRLTAYPADLLSSPIDQKEASLQVRAGGPPLAPDTTRGTDAAQTRGVDDLTRAFTDLVARQRLTPGFAALALLIAIALGGLHALAPGHGKTIMAAYAVATGDRHRVRRDVLTLGLTVTITHTAGVLALGLIVASGSVLAPTTVYPWLGIAGGLLVAVTGVTLLQRAVRKSRTQHHHGHGHGHHHKRSGVALMGFAGGMVPSPSAVLVLVGATAIGQAWFGVLLVLGYGMGLALTLIAIGLIVIGSGRALAARLPTKGKLDKARALLPVGTAAAVLLLGLGLVLRSLPAAV